MFAASFYDGPGSSNAVVVVPDPGGGGDGGGPYTPAFAFDDPRNSMYLPIL